MLKRTHESVRAENYLLRDALREANRELRKYKTLLSDISLGHGSIAEKLEKVLNDRATK